MVNTSTSIMAFRGAPCIYTRASLAVALTLWCLYSTITLHCTWLHLQPAYIHLFFTCSLTTAVVRTRTSTCWPTATGYNKVFQSITISFLPVGHTHEDIDQMFSTFVIGMKYNPQVLTVEAFIQGLQDWYSAPHLRPEPIFLLECWSIKSWTPTFRGFRAPPGLMFSASPAMKLMCRCIPRTTAHQPPPGWVLTPSSISAPLTLPFHWSLHSWIPPS